MRGLEYVEAAPQFFLSRVKIVTAMSRIIMSGFKMSGDRYCTVITPTTAPTRVKGICLRTKRRLSFPARIKVAVLATVPIVEAALLVPSASVGGMPAISSAGNEMSPPPPAMASTKAARNPAASSGINIDNSNGIDSPAC